MSSTREFYLPFIKKEKVAKDTYSFYFDRVASNATGTLDGAAKRDFDFLPGQYIAMTLKIKNPDNRGIERPFTIASSPLEKECIMIATKVISHSGKRSSALQNGAHPESLTAIGDSGQARMTGYEICSSFKKELLEINPKDMVKFSGPWGGFVFKEKEMFPRVFLAGGIGITPFHSMITYANVKKLSIPITLIVSFSTIEEIVFREELEDIANRNPRIKVIYTVTQPEKSRIRWKGETGRISDGLIKKYVPNILEPQYFIVGPPAFVAAIEEVVRNIGVPNERIFIENFTGY